MGREILGNSYSYTVDESYGINKDGFIAIGTESIVYKGLKTKRGGGVQFSCVLKFKPKLQPIDGKIVNRLELFKKEEWGIFEELKECRSVVRIDDLIEDLGDFSLPCKLIEGGVIDSSKFFCVVEEFIDGWNLDEFCREEFWKLRKIKQLPNGLKERVDYHDFSPDEKSTVEAGYTYDNQLKYQNQIMMFMINLCDIMEYVTERKNVLHLDIKPENIMVTRHGKELVLIDFGRSKRITQANRFVVNELSAVNYNEDERQEKSYQYGTLGYAAPECYCDARDGSVNPIAEEATDDHKMSIESDIFSLGATFWECLNIFELVTKTDDSLEDTYDFYKKYILSKDAYCNRDLTMTNTAYHQRLEKIIKKCTKARKGDYRTSDKYYHSYKELRRDIELAKDSTPTIVKEENVKVRTAFKLCGAFAAIALLVLCINLVYQGRSYQIAQNKWNNVVSNYNETQFARLRQIALDYLDAAPMGEVDNVYTKIAGFTYMTNENVSSYEAAMLVELLEKVGNDAALPGRVDEIMMRADTGNFKDISSEIVKLDITGKSVGYQLATAIYNVEVGKSNVVEAYDVLREYYKNEAFYNAVVKLKNVLDNDDNVKLIMEAKGLTRDEILSFFDSINR